MKRKFALLNFVYSIVIFNILLIILNSLAMSEVMYYNWYLIIECLIVFGLIGLNFNYLKKQFIEFVENGWKKVLKITSIAYASYIVASIVFYAIMGEPEISTNQTGVQELILFTFVPLSFSVIVVFGPLKEELLYRASLFHLFAGKNIGKADKKLKLIAAICSAYLFASIHIVYELFSFTDMYSLVMVAFPYVLMGTILVVVYVKGKYNVFYPLAFHMLNNFISYTVLVVS